MGLWELIVLAVALAMDAFAVSICKGLASTKNYIKTGLACGIWFGVFQALMPFIGWLLASAFSEPMSKYSAYIAFGLLAFLGGKMLCGAISEAIEQKKALANGVNICAEAAEKNASLAPRVMVVFAIATSIDALAAGVTLAAVGMQLLGALLAVLLIGVITFIFSFIGAAAGARIGAKFSTKAQIAGGVVLIALGIKILIEHFIA